jgi:hypothetical protein
MYDFLEKEYARMATHQLKAWDSAMDGKWDDRD